MINKTIVVQSLVVILLFVNILGMDLGAKDMWLSNKTNILTLFFTVVLLVVLLLKESPKEQEKADKHFNKRK